MVFKAAEAAKVRLLTISGDGINQHVQYARVELAVPRSALTAEEKKATKGCSSEFHIRLKFKIQYCYEYTSGEVGLVETAFGDFYNNWATRNCATGDDWVVTFIWGNTYMSAATRIIKTFDDAFDRNSKYYHRTLMPPNPNNMPVTAS